jgi:hypothetical protein
MSEILQSMLNIGSDDGNPDGDTTDTKSVERKKNKEDNWFDPYSMEERMIPVDELPPPPNNIPDEQNKGLNWGMMKGMFLPERKNKLKGGGAGQMFPDGDGTEQGLLPEEDDFWEKLGKGKLKIKDIVPNSISQGIGTIFSNAKRPAVYGDEFSEPVDYLESTMNFLKGEDKSAWNLRRGGDADPENVKPGSSFDYSSVKDSKSEIQARDFLTRKGFGLSDELSSRGDDITGLIDKGNNNYEINPEGELGSDFYRKFNKYASDWATEETRDWDEEEKNQGYKTKKRIEGRVLPVMANTNPDSFDFVGEGEDEDGYYNKVRLHDSWDFALRPGEKINSPTNLGRSILDQFMAPPNVTAETKVRIPGVRLQKRNPSSRLGSVQRYD